MDERKAQTISHPPQFSRSLSTPTQYDELASVQLVLRQHLKKLISWFHVWRSWQKRIFLCNLVENCTIGQLKLLATALEPVLHVDFTTVFPLCEEATDSTSSLTVQHSLVRKLTQQNLKEFYDTHPIIFDNISSTTDNATTSGGSVCFSKDAQSPTAADATTFKTFSLDDRQDTLFPLPLPRFHRRHKLSLGSSNHVSEDFYSFTRKNWHSSHTGRGSSLHRHVKSKSVESHIFLKPQASQLTEQFKDQLSTVSKVLTTEINTCSTYIHFVVDGGMG